MKIFNTAGTCRPNEHYMVDITERLEIIRGMVAKGNYFCINRGRQYDKTTTLRNLKRHLEDQGYSVFYISFENYDEYYFETDDRLGAAFLNSLCWCLQQGLVYNTTRDAEFGLLYFRDKHEQSCPLKLLSHQRHRQLSHRRADARP